MNLIIPILPFKFVGFIQCTHVITFLDDDEYDSIEFISYDNGVSGDGVEVIITDKSNNQVILASKERNYLNIMKSGRAAYKGDINLDINKKNSMVSIELSCKSPIHTVELSFRSLFPVSDIRAGKVDPKRHNSKGMPFMYSSQNTVGKMVDVIIDGRKIQVKYSDDSILKQLNGIQSYYSENFNLGVISVQDKKICLKEIKDNVLYYETSDRDIISFSRNQEIGVMKFSNYIDKCNYEFIFSKERENDIEAINLKYDGKITLKIIFQELSSSVQEKSERIVGNLIFQFANCEEKFSCDLICDMKTTSINNEENLIIAEYVIKHENENWEEKARILNISVSCSIDKSNNQLKTIAVENMKLNKT